MRVRKESYFTVNKEIEVINGPLGEYRRIFLEVKNGSMVTLDIRDDLEDDLRKIPSIMQFVGKSESKMEFIKLLVGVSHLYKRGGGELNQKTYGDLIGITCMSVSNYLKSLIKLGILKNTNKSYKVGKYSKFYRIISLDILALDSKRIENSICSEENLKKMKVASTRSRNYLENEKRKAEHWIAFRDLVDDNYKKLGLLESGIDRNTITNSCNVILKKELIASNKKDWENYVFWNVKRVASGKVDHFPYPYNFNYIRDLNGFEAIEFDLIEYKRKLYLELIDTEPDYDSEEVEKWKGMALYNFVEKFEKEFHNQITWPIHEKALERAIDLLSNHLTLDKSDIKLDNFDKITNKPIKLTNLTNLFDGRTQTDLEKYIKNTNKIYGKKLNTELYKVDNTLDLKDLFKKIGNVVQCYKFKPKKLINDLNNNAHYIKLAELLYENKVIPLRKKGEKYTNIIELFAFAYKKVMKRKNLTYKKFKFKEEQLKNAKPSVYTFCAMSYYVQIANKVKHNKYLNDFNRTIFIENIKSNLEKLTKSLRFKPQHLPAHKLLYAT
jgi:hypothetical protein